MANRLRLLDLFGNLTEVWPADEVRNEFEKTEPDPSDLNTWLQGLNQGVEITGVRTGAADKRIAVEAGFGFDAAASAYPEGFPFSFRTMPNVKFRIQTIDVDKGARLFVSQSDLGPEILIEGLPVEIILPYGLVGVRSDLHLPSWADSEDRKVGEFIAGQFDSLEIGYHFDSSTTIRVHIRLRITSDFQVELIPSVPISFSDCTFIGLDCLAVHDFQLIPSPEIGANRIDFPSVNDGTEHIDWLRHSIMPWSYSQSAETGRKGCFATRSIHLDSSSPKIRWLTKKLQQKTDIEPNVEFVIDDVVCSFYADYLIPIIPPRHITIGLRRAINDPRDSGEVFAFDKAPVILHIGRDPAWGLIIEKAFFESRPWTDLSEDELNFGVTFSAAIFFAKDVTQASDAYVVEVAEDFTLRAGYRRDVETEENEPNGAGSARERVLDVLLHHEIAGTVIDIFGFKLGFSFGRFIGGERDFGDLVEVLFDLFIKWEPSGDENSILQLRGLNGEKVAFGVQDIGWRQGTLHLDGLAIPDGVVVRLWRIGLVIQELGMIAEDGGSYLSFTGGLLIEPPTGFVGGVTVKRMRFNLPRDQHLPSFKLDGLFASFSSVTSEIAAGGYYTDETIEGVRRREFAFSGKIHATIFPITPLSFRLDLLMGDVEGVKSFDYTMFQIVLRSVIPIYAFEVRGIRVLRAENMIPKLDKFDEESGDFRYFNWSRKNDPLTVTPDRFLAAWTPQNKAWALGIGCTLSLTGCGEVARLRCFVLRVESSIENGILVTLELFLFSSAKPAGYGVYEYDFENNKWGVMFGVELKLSTFVPGKLDWLVNWLDDIAQITGTVVIGNKPDTVAIGRLADQRTWLSFVFDADIWVFHGYAKVAFCYEHVEGVISGMGAVLRSEGGINAGVVRITYHAGLGWVVSSFKTGSVDSALLVFIEAGIRAVLFGFLRFGLSARAELRGVGTDPTMNELSLRIRFETPWFLPDVTWKFETAWGSVEPAKLEAFLTPLRDAAASHSLTGASQAVHVERWDDAWSEDTPNRTHSLTAFRAKTIDEASRIKNFIEDPELEPIATDSTIALSFNAIVNDTVGYKVPENVKTDHTALSGVQTSGTASNELSIRYELVNIRVRARPKFVKTSAWRIVDEFPEIACDFTDPGGIKLTASIGPHELTAYWDTDIQIEGTTVTKKLLINASTPFEFLTANPERDEELIRENPNWPCCQSEDVEQDESRWHSIDFRGEIPGSSILGARKFSNSASRLHFLRSAVARPNSFGTRIEGEPLVAALAVFPGVLLEAELAEDAVRFRVRLAWRTQGESKLVVIAFDGQGEVVGQVDEDLVRVRDFHDVHIQARRPARRLQIAIIGGLPSLNEYGGSDFEVPTLRSVEIDSVAYFAVSDLVDQMRDGALCDPSQEEFQKRFSGNGKLFFLPNHEYELEIKTRLTAGHPSVEDECAEVSEYVYFATKGLPGLNATNRVGEEIEPYVKSIYIGGRGILYREEPIAIAFKEDFHIAIPLDSRWSGSSAESTQLFRMALTATPNQAKDLETEYTATGKDWIDRNRREESLPASLVWHPKVAPTELFAIRARSDDHFRNRLAAITQREGSQCGIDDPRDVVLPILIARPSGTRDPEDETRELWAANTGYVASVRPENAPFLDRTRFEVSDKSAFIFKRDTAISSGGAWTVREGQLCLMPNAGRQFAVFGDPEWDHLSVHVAMEPGVGNAGVAFSLSETNNVERGIFVMVEHYEEEQQLVIYRRSAGREMIPVESAPLTEVADSVINLNVDAFDDLIRASVGNVSIQATRDNFRKGRIALVGDGPVCFLSLRVSGLVMYHLPFQVSKFASFTDHIHSFSGEVDTVQTNTLGPQSTLKTISELWQETAPEIVEVMNPQAQTQDREALFSRWITLLGMPLKKEIVDLEISRFVEEEGISAFLIESPEPLDFTEEITIDLRQRLQIAPHPDLNKGVFEAFLNKVFSRYSVADLMGSDELHPIGIDLTARMPERRSRWNQRRLRGSENAVSIRNLGHRSGSLRANFRMRPDFSETLRSNRLVAAFEIGDLEGTGKRRVNVYCGPTVRRSSRDFMVVAKPRGSITIDDADIANNDESRVRLDPGTVLFLDVTSGTILDWFLPRFEYREIDVTILQNGIGTCALIIPRAGTSTTHLTSRRFELTFTLERSRWDSMDSKDDLNHYESQCLLNFAVD